MKPSAVKPKSIEERVSLYLKSKKSKKQALEGAGIFDWFKKNLTIPTLKLYNVFLNAYNKHNSSNEHPLYSNFSSDQVIYPGSNYIGPKNRTDKEYLQSFPPNGYVDEVAKEHDLTYEQISMGNFTPQEKALLIQQADKKMIHELEGRNDVKSKIARAGIQGKNIAEEILSIYNRNPTVLYGGKITRKKNFEANHK